MSTPAATLRAAAALIRETAADANSELWDALFPDSRAPHIKATNAWIRLMSPDKAEHLAAWLENIAAEAETHAAQGWGNDQAEITDGHPITLARAILGRTQ